MFLWASSIKVTRYSPAAAPGVRPNLFFVSSWQVKVEHYGQVGLRTWFRWRQPSGFPSGPKASVNLPQLKVLDALESYLHEESLDKRQQPLDTSGFKIKTVAKLPQQDYDYESGIFIFEPRGAEITFTEQEIDFFRQKMVLEIADSKLWF